MTTKKILAAFDPKRPDTKSSDFLAPVIEDGKPVFIGLKSKKTVQYGTVVFVGRELSANDVFARLVDTGRKIDSVSKCLADLEAYLQAVSTQRLGDVLGLSYQPTGISLVPTNLRPDVK